MSVSGEWVDGGGGLFVVGCECLWQRKKIKSFAPKMEFDQLNKSDNFLNSPRKYLSSDWSSIKSM